MPRWLSSRISRPLSELARKTSEIDLDRLDQSFESERTDEIGALSRLLGGMTERLRTSSARLREAERRAAVGDLARQVNHDIKNGLAPIRNVLRHLSQVARPGAGAPARGLRGAEGHPGVERRVPRDAGAQLRPALAHHRARALRRERPGRGGASQHLGRRHGAARRLEPGHTAGPG